jgi:hypothetical protein
MCTACQGRGRRRGLNHHHSGSTMTEEKQSMTSDENKIDGGDSHGKFKESKGLK